MTRDKWNCMGMYVIALVAAICGYGALGVVVAVYAGALRIAFAIEQRA